MLYPLNRSRHLINALVTIIISIYFILTKNYYFAALTLGITGLSFIIFFKLKNNLNRFQEIFKQNHTYYRVCVFSFFGLLILSMLSASKNIIINKEYLFILGGAFYASILYFYYLVFFKKYDNNNNLA